MLYKPLQFTAGLSAVPALFRITCLGGVRNSVPLNYLHIESNFSLVKDVAVFHRNMKLLH
jgi:hypothetical protein